MSSISTQLAGLRIQSSVYGQVLPRLYGLNRLSGKLLDYLDFLAIPHTSPTNVGGKGGSGQFQKSTTYTYQAAVVIALCRGQIKGLLSIWDTKGVRQQTSAIESDTIPGTPFNITVANASSWATDLGVAFSVPYTDTYNDYGSDGPRVVSSTNFIPLQAVTGAPTAGQYSVVNGIYTFAAADAGKLVQITYSYAASGVPVSTYALTVFDGRTPQTPWGYLTSNHPGRDLAYSGIAYAANALMDLGDTGELPNLSYEVMGLFPGLNGDALASDILNDILTSTTDGAGFIGAQVGDWTNFINACKAYSLYYSPVYDQQDTLSNVITTLLQAANAKPLWSEGKFKIIPLFDMSARANGALYTPPTSPIYDLDDDDFIVQGEEDPVLIDQPSYADQYNIQKIEFLNRDNSYNPETVEDKDEAAVSIYGTREASVITAHFITTKSSAAQAANFINRRQLWIDGGPSYRWSSDIRKCLLEPGDLVTLTDTALGLSLTPVRITQITVGSDFKHTFVAEAFPFGTATATLFPKQGGSPFMPQQDADPGSINTPIIFEAWNRLANFDGYELWFGVSGQSPNWGGCSVYASTDGVTYALAGPTASLVSPSRMGRLTSDLPIHTDPDTVNTLAVDVSESAGILLGGAQADCDNFNLLCFVGAKNGTGTVSTTTSAGVTTVTWVSGDKFDSDWGKNPVAAIMIAGTAYVIAPNGVSDDQHLTLTTVAPTLSVAAYSVLSGKGELISFQTASLISAYHYNLGTRLRRGVWGSGLATGVTTGSSHPTGSTFIRLDEAVGKFQYDPRWVGQIIYLKFPSFNRFGRRQQSLADVPAYAFLVPGFETGMQTGQIALRNGDWELNSTLEDVSGAPDGWRVILGGASVQGALKLSFDVVDPYSGTRSLVIEVLTSPGGQVLPEDIYECAPGERLRIGGAIKQLVGGPSVIQLGFFDLDGNGIPGGSGSISVNPGVWELEPSLVVIAPSDPAVAYVRLGILPGITAGDKAKFDVITLSRIAPSTNTPLGRGVITA